MMYLAKTPSFIKPLAKDLTWSIPTKERVLYLTFDDGPIPEVTPWVIETLARYNAKATFFCIGDNVRKHRGVFDQIIAAGHAYGNHTFHHLDGWNTGNRAYFRDIHKCSELVSSKLFRPPYGKIRRSQATALKSRYSIIMWDVLSADFDQKISKEKCLDNVLENAGNGSIIVFHDSLKASPNLYYALPKVLEHFASLNYRFEALPMNN